VKATQCTARLSGEERLSLGIMARQRLSARFWERVGQQQRRVPSREVRK
jgi:hypothetical protein